jgi:3-carboxy-cis,cis-muconate cycloisomerase
VSEGLLGGVLARGDTAGCLDDRAWLRAMLDVEAALARAQARLGLVSEAAAEAVAAACEPDGEYDVEGLGRSAADAGNPVVPLVRAIRERAGAAADAVHRGATSQDVLDTAVMLLARDALVPVRADLHAAADAAARQAVMHRDTVVTGRTLLQHAVPTTFGLKAAGWTAGLDGAAGRLDAVVHLLPVQLGGAAGTLAGQEGRGAQVVAALAAELGLAEPVLPWHTVRLPIADLAGSLGAAAGVVGKIGLDVVLLAQSEVAEVREGVPGRGGSSAMAHKNNPVAAVSARAAALRAPGLVATLLTAAQLQEHERAAGGWHAEWLALADLLRTVGSAAAWIRDCLEHLEVDAARMAATSVAAERERGAPGSPDVGEAGVLVDRVLARRRARASAEALVDAPAVAPGSTQGSAG